MQHEPSHPVNLSILMEEAIQIAWEYLERAGKIEHAELCSHILSRSVETMIRQGVRSRLLLSNRAITMCEHVLQAQAMRDAS